MQDTRSYYRPLVQIGPARPAGALTLAGGWGWFTHIERLSRHHAPAVIEADAALPELLDALTRPRADLAGLGMGRPQIMGILNVTPDSFSDGGVFDAPNVATERALQMLEDGAAIIDIGGESTRPGADFVDPAQEIARTVPVIEALRARTAAPLSIDTRKASVARSAVAAGASLINDVSALGHDADMAQVVAASGLPVCLMHSGGDPKTMQDSPHYEDVLLEVYDSLAERIKLAVAAGIPAARICVDPGIGFGKTQAHNLALLARLSLFHTLGCAVLLGASRKRFIGTLGREPEAAKRGPGSIGVALAAVAQGVQLLRVHDIRETDQALRLWRAAQGGE